MLEAGSSKDPAANPSATTQNNRQSPSPDIHATLFSTGHPPGRRDSKLPSSTLAPWANGHTPHDTEPISAVLGFETRLKCRNDVVTLNPKDPLRQHNPARSCPDGGIERYQLETYPSWADQPVQPTHSRRRVEDLDRPPHRRLVQIYRPRASPQGGFPVKPTLPTTHECLVNA